MLRCWLLLLAFMDVIICSSHFWNVKCDCFRFQTQSEFCWRSRARTLESRWGDCARNSNYLIFVIWSFRRNFFCQLFTCTLYLHYTSLRVGAAYKILKAATALVSHCQIRITIDARNAWLEFVKWFLWHIQWRWLSSAPRRLFAFFSPSLLHWWWMVQSVRARTRSYTYFEYKMLSHRILESCNKNINQVMASSRASLASRHSSNVRQLYSSLHPARSGNVMRLL